jgi:N6-L-threonylcarbamoyladenine synthase
MLIETGHATQPIKLGVDSGEKHIGLSAKTEKKEVFSARVELRTDMVKLNSERRTYRRNRRNRKTWYRPARFSNRAKPKGWLAPSIQHKLDSHQKYVEFVKKLLPITEVQIEVANFDIQKIKNPDIEGVGYQQGLQSGFWNAREYVLHRDGHLCQFCKGKSKDKILSVHHLKSRQTGGDRPDNLITLCETCHKEYHAGKIELKVKRKNGFKAETFMSTIRWMFVNNLQEQGYNVSHTFGYITKSGRIALKLPKSHINDAFVIADGTIQSRCQSYLIKQVRKNNRKLFKGDRSQFRNTAPRFVKGFQRYDKVSFTGIECFVFGRRSTGNFDLRLLDGTKVHASAKSSRLKLLESSSTSLIQFLPVLKDGVSLERIL